MTCNVQPSFSFILIFHSGTNIASTYLDCFVEKIWFTLVKVAMKVIHHNLIFININLTPRLSSMSRSQILGLLYFCLIHQASCNHQLYVLMQTTRIGHPHTQNRGHLRPKLCLWNISSFEGGSK